MRYDNGTFTSAIGLIIALGGLSPDLHAADEASEPATGGPSPSAAGTGSSRPGARVPCPRGREPALAEIGCEMVRALGTSPDGSVLVAGSTDDVPPSLLKRAARIVAGRLGARVVPPTVSAEQRRTMAPSAIVLRLQATLKHGKLSLTVDVERGRLTLWDRVRGVGVGPFAHAYAERPVDAEIRRHLPAPSLLLGDGVRAPSPERNPLALACGELRPGAGPEIVIVGRRAIHVGRPGSGRFVRRTSRPWEDIAPIAPTPLRQPIGTAAIVPGGILTGVSDRARGALLDGALEPTATFPRLAPWPDGDGCLAFGPRALKPGTQTCFEKAFARPTEQSGPTDAIAGAWVSQPDGPSIGVRAYRIANRPRLKLTRTDGQQAHLEPVGAQVAIGDLDLDGLPEVLTSRATLNPAADALRIHTWGNDGSLRERLQRPFASPIRAIAVCPPSGTSLRPIVVATVTHLWVFGS